MTPDALPHYLSLRQVFWWIKSYDSAAVAACHENPKIRIGGTVRGLNKGDSFIIHLSWGHGTAVVGIHGFWIAKVGLLEALALEKAGPSGIEYSTPAPGPWKGRSPVPDSHLLPEYYLHENRAEECQAILASIKLRWVGDLDFVEENRLTSTWQEKYPAQIMCLEAEDGIENQQILRQIQTAFSSAQLNPTGRHFGHRRETIPSDHRRDYHLYFDGGGSLIQEDDPVLIPSLLKQIYEKQPNKEIPAWTELKFSKDEVIKHWPKKDAKAYLRRVLEEAKEKNPNLTQTESKVIAEDADAYSTREEFRRNDRDVFNRKRGRPPSKSRQRPAK